MLSAVAASFDRAFARVAFRPGRMGEAEHLHAQARIEGLTQLAAFYEHPPLTQPDAFFPLPPTPQLELRRRENDAWDASWPSRYEPFNNEVASGYLSYPKNEHGSARLFLHADRPRPAIIFIHGYLGGVHTIEQRIWPIEALFERGLDIALFTLPFHGTRRTSRLKAPAFPNSDPRVTIEGFRQAMHDLRGLISWLEDRGCPGVGVMGMSLGGYTTALVATIDARVRFAIPHVPLASIADFARDGGRLIGSVEEQQAQYDLLCKVHRQVSPLARPPLVDTKGLMVVAGHADRITPMAHARKIANHFGAPLEVFPGGHLWQRGRRHAFSILFKMLRTLELID